jgi:hypothetical protein
MAAIGRRVTPWVLQQIAGSDLQKGISSKNRALRWLFAIPEVPDTRTLSIDRRTRNEKIRWSEVKKAIVWELFFGIILAICVRLNPFISDKSPTALLGIFGMLISGSVLIQMIILLWYVFGRLSTRINGVI